MQIIPVCEFQGKFDFSKKNNSYSFKVNIVIMKMLKRNLQHLQQS